MVRGEGFGDRGSRQWSLLRFKKPIPAAKGTRLARFAVSLRPGDHPRAFQKQYTTVWAPASAKIEHVHAGSGLPGQLGLVDLLAMSVFEEIGIDVAGEAGVPPRNRPNWPGGA